MYMIENILHLVTFCLMIIATVLNTISFIRNIRDSREHADKIAIVCDLAEWHRRLIIEQIENRLKNSDLTKSEE